MPLSTKEIQKHLKKAENANMEVVTKNIDIDRIAFKVIFKSFWAEAKTMFFSVRLTGQGHSLHVQCVGPNVPILLSSYEQLVGCIKTYGYTAHSDKEEHLNEGKD